MKATSECREAEEIRLHLPWGCTPAGPAALDNGQT